MKTSRSRRRFLMFLGATGTASLSLAMGTDHDHEHDEGALAADEAEFEEVDEEFDALEDTFDAQAVDADADVPDVPDRVSTDLQAYFTKPDTGGDASYLRYTPIGILKSGSAIELTLKQSFYLPPRAVTISIYGPPSPGAPLADKGRVVASALVSPRQKKEVKNSFGRVIGFRWVYDWKVPAGLPGGNYVLHADWTATLPASIVIANGVAPALWAPRKLAVCTANMKGDRPNTGHTWFWVDYPAKRRSHPLAKRPGTKFSKPMSIDNMWVEDISASTGPFLREPIEVEGGWVVTNPQQRYNQNNAFRELGDLRAGKRMDGRPGCVVSGTAFADGLYALTPIGACFVDLAGEVTPLFGRFMKPGALYPYGEAMRKKNHHLVGVWQCPGGLDQAMAMCVTNDRRTAYVADSGHNRILKVDLTTSPATVTHLAGRYLKPDQPQCAHSAYGERMKGGQVDGPGDAADFGHPLGVLLSDDEQTLYIGDDHNCAIRAIDLRTRNVKTVVQSSMVHDHSKLPLGKSQVELYRKAMAFDGPFGDAIFMHVGQMAWDSKGRIIAAIHHTFELRRFDLVNRKTERVAWTAFGTRTDMQKNAWVSVDVDRTGELGVVDRIVCANWFAGTEDMYLPTGNDKYSAKQDILRNSPPGYPRLSTGPARHIPPNGYPWFVKVGPGCLWIHDSSNGLLTRITEKRPGDPEPSPLQSGSKWTSRTKRHERGAFLWFSAQPAGGPPRFLMHGASGDNQLGFELLSELGAMTDAELAQVLNRSQYSDADWEALLAYVRTITLTSRQ